MNLNKNIYIIMSFNQECIFCLELLQTNDSCYKKKDKDYKNKQHKDYQNLLLDIVNTNVKLKCNHCFHSECFFLYVKYNCKILNSLKCPICRYSILKNDIRKILITYFIMLKKLHFKISINNFLKWSKDDNEIYNKINFYETQDTQEIYETYDTQEFLKNKICFRSRQILKLVCKY